MRDLATLGVPELAHVPLLPVGGSHGAVAAWSIACALPERVLAAACLEPMVCLPGLLTLSACEVPIVVFNGALANGRRDRCARALRESRLHGARTAHVNIEGMGHEDGPTHTLTYPFLESVIRRRLPAHADPRLGPVPLSALPIESGWLVDAGSAARPSLPAPAGEAGAAAASPAFWLPERSLAHTFACLAQPGPGHVLRATPVGQPERRLGTTRAHEPLQSDLPVAPRAKHFDLFMRDGDVIALGVEQHRGNPAPVTAWTRIDFFRDGEVVAVCTEGEPERALTLHAGERLFQTFTACVHYPDGTRRATRYGVTLLVEPHNPHAARPESEPAARVGAA